MPRLLPFVKICRLGLIDLLIRTFCKPAQDNILICSPTYAMYEFLRRCTRYRDIRLTITEDFNLNVADIVQV
ncbi:hypothetical protein O9993_10990 [Vibrio lentus]|nr:hypothetical protein [Vibrio lentus]